MAGVSVLCLYQQELRYIYCAVCLGAIENRKCVLEDCFNRLGFMAAVVYLLQLVFSVSSQCGA